MLWCSETSLIVKISIYFYPLLNIIRQVRRRFSLLISLRRYGLRQSDGGSCAEPGGLLYLQHRESFPLYWSWWICPQIQPQQLWVWLSGWCSVTALQIQDHCKNISALVLQYSQIVPRGFILFFCVELHPLQDKAQPETQARSFGSVAFNALLAVDDSEALALVRQPGSDGFRLDSTALFQVCMKKCNKFTTNISFKKKKKTCTESGFITWSCNKSGLMPLSGEITLFELQKMTIGCLSVWHFTFSFTKLRIKTVIFALPVSLRGP